ncbi:MAG: N-6 DNA methylase [Dehalococcoidia bacterium]
MVASTSSPGPHRLVSLCDALGYGAELRSERYAILMGSGVVEVDLACFSRPEPKDLSTATIVAGQVDHEAERIELRESARALAAPVALLDDSSSVQLWRIAPQATEDRLLETDLREDRLAEKGRLRDALAPESLVAHKQGFAGQLALFERDISLLTGARARAGEALGARIEAAMADLWTPTGVEPSTAEAEDIARTVVQALAVLVARDKMTADRDFDTALAVLQERFGDVVTDLARPARRQRVQRAASIIGEGLKFDSLDATILGDVYEGTFLQDATRQRLGAYYTPPAIARKMLESIPVEELEPVDRTVLDLTCGSGTLLLAAWDRLALAMPPGPELTTTPGHLTGYDQDMFAVELARLALVIHDAAGRPSSKVERRDALRPRRGSELCHSIVVGNPPWGYERPEGVPTERATVFLDAMLRWCRPEGFIACVLPASWLTANVARDSRAKLRTCADVFEIWRLPETTFGLSGVASCVVFARKRQPSIRRWIYRRVHRDALQHFLRDVRNVSAKFIDEESVPTSAPFGDLSSDPRFAGLRRLVDVAEVRRGVPTPKGKARGSAEGNVAFLPGYGKQHAFGRVGTDHVVPARYPEDFSKRGESPAFWTRPKVLMATTTNVDGTRARAFLDEHGVVPRNSMTAIVPFTNDAAHRAALLAILNSSMVAAWLDVAAMRWIGSALIENIPVPDNEQWPALGALGSRLAAEAESGPISSILRDELDAALADAYGLVKDLPDGVPVATRVEGPNLDVPQLAIGTVLDVREGEILLHVAGFTEPYGAWMPPPRAMPGWACRAGMGLQVLGPEVGLESAIYLPQEMAWTRGRGRQPEVTA